MVTDTGSVFIPRRVEVPPDAPAMRVNQVAPEEQAAQAAADQDVAIAFQQWIDAGEPSLFNKSPRQLYPIPKEEVDRIDKDGRNGIERSIKHLNNAARLIPGCRIKIAKPVRFDDDGTALLFWVAKKRKPRETSATRGAATPRPTRSSGAAQGSRPTTSRRSSTSEPPSSAPQTSADWRTYGVPFRAPEENLPRRDEPP